MLLSCSRQLAICPDIDIVIVFEKTRLLAQSWRRANRNRETFEELPNFLHNVKFFSKDFIAVGLTHKLDDHFPSAVPQLLIHDIRSYPSYLEDFFTIHQFLLEYILMFSPNFRNNRW